MFQNNWVKNRWKFSHIHLYFFAKITLNRFLDHLSIHPAVRLSIIAAAWQTCYNNTFLLCTYISSKLLFNVKLFSISSISWLEVFVLNSFDWPSANWRESLGDFPSFQSQLTSEVCARKLTFPSSGGRHGVQCLSVPVWKHQSVKLCL